MRDPSHHTEFLTTVVELICHYVRGRSLQAPGGAKNKPALYHVAFLQLKDEQLIDRPCVTTDVREMKSCGTA